MDKDLPEKLRAELPGILAWAVRGCLAWQREGLCPPQVVLLATERYKEDSDELRDYLAERTIKGRNKQIRLADLFGDYSRWSDEMGERHMGKKQFIQALTERGLHIAPGAGNQRYVYGIDLLPTPMAIRFPHTEVRSSQIA